MSAVIRCAELPRLFETKLRQLIYVPCVWDCVSGRLTKRCASSHHRIDMYEVYVYLLLTNTHACLLLMKKTPSSQKPSSRCCSMYRGSRGAPQYPLPIAPVIPFAPDAVGRLFLCVAGRGSGARIPVAVRPSSHGESPIQRRTR